MPVLTDLTVQPAKIESPTDQITKAISLRGLMTENALRNQQIQQSQQQTQNLQAEAQKRQRDLGDQQAVQQSLLSNKGDWDKTFSDLQGKISPDNFSTLQTSHYNDVKAKASANSEQLKNETEQFGKLDNWLQGLNSLPEDQRSVEYKNGLNRFKTDPTMSPIVQKGSDIGLLPDQYDPTAITRAHTFVVGHAGTLKEAQTAQETKTAASTEAKNTQDVVNLKAAQPGIEAESKQKQSHLPVAQALDAATLASPGLLTPEQQQQQKQFEREQTTRNGNLAVAQGDLALKTAKQNAEIGPESAQTWVDVLKKNPDAEKEIPPALRNKVATLFHTQTGLPMPTAAAATSQASEIANRNALDNAEFIQKAIQNPEIQKRLGPILGRLGTFEQSLGTATAGLSPEAAKLAQELRTRMRYFVFQEGRGILGGRMPQQLMQALETSSANVHMDEPTLTGALKGAVGAALANADNVDKERFGGVARPRVLRGLSPGDVRTVNGREIASDDGGKTVYDAKTGEIIPR